VRPVDGDALRDMTGDRVAVQQRGVALLGRLVEIVGVEPDLAAFCLDQQRSSVAVDGEYAAAVAVVDSEPGLVALDHDVVARGELAAGQLQLVPVEGTRGVEAVACARVERGDVGAAVGDHDRVGASGASRGPVCDEPAAGVGGGLADVDTVVGGVLPKRRLGLSG
jgi:hypothetical protein